MSKPASTYELGPADYAWALGAIQASPAGRGAYGLLVRVDRADNWMRRWVLGAIALVALSALAVFLARRFGATSIAAIAAYAAALVLPCLWVAGTWLWDRLWSRVDRALASSTAGGLIEKIERGEAPLPLGSVEMRWDHAVLRVAGGGHLVEVPWSDRPLVRREGDRVLVMPCVPGAGVPDVRRLAIVPSRAFADEASFERAIEEWSSRARA